MMLQESPVGHAFRDGYLAGLDGRWRSPSAEYVVSGAFVQSYIRGGPVVRQPDGTLIGAGATSPGGWLRVAKEGGKHLLWSAEYTGAGRTLSTTTSATWRGRTCTCSRRRSAGASSSPARTPREIDGVGGDAEPQPVGPRSRPALRAERAAQAAQLRVDPSRRRLRAGALRRPRGRRRHGAGTRALLRRAARARDRSARLLYATLANQTQLMGARHLRHRRAGQPGGARAPPARHRAPAAADLVGGRVSLRAPGGRRPRATTSAS